MATVKDLKTKLKTYVFPEEKPLTQEEYDAHISAAAHEKGGKTFEQFKKQFDLWYQEKIQLYHADK